MAEADKDLTQKKPTELKPPQKRHESVKGGPISGNPEAHDYVAWGGVEREKNGHIYYRV